MGQSAAVAAVAAVETDVPASRDFHSNADRGLNVILVLIEGIWRRLGAIT